MEARRPSSPNPALADQPYPLSALVGALRQLADQRRFVSRQHCGSVSPASASSYQAQSKLGWRSCMSKQFRGRYRPIPSPAIDSIDCEMQMTTHAQALCLAPRMTRTASSNPSLGWPEVMQVQSSKATSATRARHHTKQWLEIGNFRQP